MRHWKKLDVNFAMTSSVTELWRRWVSLTIKCAISPKLLLISKTGEARVLFHDFLLLFCISDIFVKLYTIKKLKMMGRNYHFITSLRIWPYRDINIRIYSGTVDKWHNIIVTSLIWHMTPSPCTIALILRCGLSKKSPNARFADCPPIRPLHSSNFCCLDLCCDNLSPKCGDGGTVYPPVVLTSYP